MGITYLSRVLFYVGFNVNCPRNKLINKVNVWLSKAD